MAEDTAPDVCLHMNDTVQTEALKEHLSKNQAWLRRGSTPLKCVKCKGTSTSNAADLWMCLHCATLLCGRGSKAHALQHFQANPTHAVALSLTGMIWCYGCDEEVLDAGSPIPAGAGSKVSPYAAEMRAIVRPPEGETSRLRASGEAKPGEDEEEEEEAPAYESSAGKCGLSNLGNTCFMNSMLQSLSNVEPLARVSVEVPAASLQAPNSLAVSMSQVLTEMWSGRYDYVSPAMVLRSLRRVNPMFEGYAQHDAQEALRFLLMDMHEHLAVAVPLGEVPHYVSSTTDTAEPVKDSSGGSESSVSAGLPTDPAPVASPKDSRAWLHDGPYTGAPTTEQSIVSDLFRGALASTVTCRGCGTASTTRDHFYDLSLSIPRRRPSSAPADGQSSSMFCRLFGGGNIRLIDCLYQFCTPEPLVGRDKYHCEVCKDHKDADKVIRVAQLPEVLVIHLKRFNYGSMWGSKVGTTVSFPLEHLDMAPFMASAGGKASPAATAGAGASARSGRVASAPVPSDTVYNLVSVVEHMGSLHAGHYIAFGKSRDGSWHKFDDSRVSPASVAKVARQEAYLLVYQRRFKPLAIAKPLPSEDTPFVYVSKYWWIKRQTCSFPGPASAAVLMCDHDNLKNDLKQVARSLVVGLTRSQYEWVQSQYGSTRVLLSLHGCVTCKREQEALSTRRDTEKARIRATDTASIDEHQAWYIISETWLESWRQFIDNRGPRDGTGRGTLPPGPISNHKLLRPDGKTPLPNLRKISSFRGVNAHVWNFLFGIYGGGPALPRANLDIYDESPLPGSGPLATAPMPGEAKKHMSAV